MADVWEFEGDWYCNDAAGMSFCVSTREGAEVARAYFLARAENARLREAIERAPHERRCRVNTLLHDFPIDPKHCNCWKRDALGGEKE